MVSVRKAAKEKLAEHKKVEECKWHKVEITKRSKGVRKRLNAAIRRDGRFDNQRPWERLGHR